jgi:hypothetical protein
MLTIKSNKYTKYYTAHSYYLKKENYYSFLNIMNLPTDEKKMYLSNFLMFL